MGIVLRGRLEHLQEQQFEEKFLQEQKMAGAEVCRSRSLQEQKFGRRSVLVKGPSRSALLRTGVSLYRHGLSIILLGFDVPIDWFWFT